MCSVLAWQFLPLWGHWCRFKGFSLWGWAAFIVHRTENKLCGVCLSTFWLDGRLYSVFFIFFLLLCGPVNCEESFVSWERLLVLDKAVLWVQWGSIQHDCVTPADYLGWVANESEWSRVEVSHQHNIFILSTAFISVCPLQGCDGCLNPTWWKWLDIVILVLWAQTVPSSHLTMFLFVVLTWWMLGWRCIYSWYKGIG